MLQLMEVEILEPQLFVMIPNQWLVKREGQVENLGSMESLSLP
jgi:hypothetical protein